MISTVNRWAGPKVFLGNQLGIIWVFPKIGVPQNGWFIMENPIKMDVLGVFPLFLEGHPYVDISLLGDFC